MILCNGCTAPCEENADSVSWVMASIREVSVPLYDMGTWKTEQCISYQKEKGCDLWLRIVPAVSCRELEKKISCNHLLSGERL